MATGSAGLVVGGTGAGVAVVGAACAGTVTVWGATVWIGTMGGGGAADSCDGVLLCRDAQKPKLTAIASKLPPATSAAAIPAALRHDRRSIRSVASSCDHASSGAG